MIGASGNPLHRNQITIESLQITWYRIVLDEAQWVKQKIYPLLFHKHSLILFVIQSIIRNPKANKTANIQKLQAKYMLCLTGTPFQNRLQDVQSLISLFKIWPWNQDWIWRQHLIPGMSIGDRHAIQTLNHLMEEVCLRRTKEVLLNLPKKVETAVLVRMGEPWEGFSRELHEEFINSFGRLRMSGEPWDLGEFFRQLLMIQQYCNHPVFAREVIPNRHPWSWRDSAKVVHLVEHVRNFLNGGRGIARPKAVIFSSYVQFLEMWVYSSLAPSAQFHDETDEWIVLTKNCEGTRLNDINSTMLVGTMPLSKRDENLGQFRSDPECNVLIGSIKAAGVGIDLRCAQNVYLMVCWFYSWF